MALLDGKVALITGAGRGLGEAYARLFASEGAAVVVNDVGTDESGRSTAEAVAENIRAGGGRAAAHTGDISSNAGGQRLLATALDTFGRADILINNAGILRDKSLLKLEEADWDRVLQVNLKSLYCTTRPVFAWMKDNGGGVIVNTSSTSGLVGNFGQTNYGASKAGVWGFSNVLALEGARFGVRVWTLVPTALSALTAPLMTEAMKLELAPEHVAHAALYMVSSLSGKRTGHTLFASGHSIRELRLVAAEGIPGAGYRPGLTAKDIAAAEEKIFRSETPLTIMDFAK
jgi:NAD(P)-dependent dehydrogenase (short-subunit alcohol dehydrogenase family)